MYFINSISRGLGEVIKYGVVYRSKSAAKKALSKAVGESRRDAAIRGYGMVYSHWNDDKSFCRLTHGKDERSSLWENLCISECTHSNYDSIGD